MLLRQNYNKNKKTQKVYLFTNAKDEKNIKEWASHHLLIGFDNIIIFDHLSNPPLKNYFVNFDKRILVIPCNWENPVKLKLMKLASSIASKNNADWMLYLDADEYLILNAFPGVKKMLDLYPGADSLGINWLMFGTNNHVKEPPGGLIDNYTKSELFLDKHVKTFVRPKEVVSITNPHYYNIFNKNNIRHISGANIPNSHPNGYAFFPNKNVFYNSLAYIAHYHYQSEESYIRRKNKRNQDDGSGNRAKDENIHSHHNVVDNETIKSKYSENLKNFIISKTNNN